MMCVFTCVCVCVCVCVLACMASCGTVGLGSNPSKAGLITTSPAVELET